MRNILLVMKNNLYRLSKNKSMLIMIGLIMPIIIGFGIYFGQTETIKGKIAIVGVSSQQEAMIKETMGENDNITFDFLEESPTNTDLIKGLYLAEINFEGDEAKVISYGKEDVKHALEANLKGEVYEGKADNTNVVGKIIGFLTMFLFMGSVMVMEFFLEDRKSRVYTRVLSGSVSYYEYMIGQLVYSISVLTVPTILIAIGVVKILSVELSISLLGFAGLIFMVGLVSTAYSMLLCNLFKSEMTVNMTAGNLAMLTSLFGGCIINIVDTNKVIGFLRDFIPQKRLLDLANSYNNADLIFLIGVVIIFISISIIVGKKHYESGEFI